MLVVLLGLWVLHTPVNAYPSRPVSVCDVLDNPAQYGKRQFVLAADLVLGPHHGVLIDDRCRGALKLVMNDKAGKGAQVAAVMGRLYAHHARGHVTLIGTFDKTPADTADGIFVLDHVSDTHK
ncbi:hypothetical protein [Rhodanobacter sp. DHB23]|uniref:hypothetical protein n=1 Tax=Rhodanobacter sp. DHB23 TaxID=2775923 RepID=UPI001783C438|nr:hypothetical protein [Rhodanobacter sp. DHB23]MBD8872374.1 hypothetical protein [Rhodanobacter sp. DHB23]